MQEAVGGEEDVAEFRKGVRRRYVEQFGKRGCSSVGGDRNSSLGGKRERGGCGRWVREEGGNSEMRAEAEVRKLRISCCLLP